MGLGCGVMENTCPAVELQKLEFCLRECLNERPMFIMEYFIITLDLVGPDQSYFNYMFLTHHVNHHLLNNPDLVLF